MIKFIKNLLLNLSIFIINFILFHRISLKAIYHMKFTFFSHFISIFFHIFFASHKITLVIFTLYLESKRLAEGKPILKDLHFFCGHYMGGG